MGSTVPQRSRTARAVAGPGRPRQLAALLGALCLVPLAASPARGQGTARSMDLDASVISAGMGGASTGVFWTAEPNQWANPALLGYHRGVRWQQARSRLVPSIEPKVWFQTRRLTLAGAGVGFEVAGEPVDIGGLELDYGAVVTDGSGMVVSTLPGFESIGATGAGVSLGRLAETILAMRGSDVPPFVRNFDLAIGYARKNTRVALLPGLPAGDAEATSRDLGVLARVGGTPTAPGFVPWPTLAVDFAYGFSVINFDDAEFVFGSYGSAPPTRQYRNGVTMRVAAGIEERPRGAGLAGLLSSGLDPTVSFGFAYDRVRAQGGAFGTPYYQDLAGLELTVYNVLSLRAGRVGDRSGGIHAASLGAGLALPIGHLAALRYDFASVPQAAGSGLPNVRRHSGSLVVDPIAIARELR